ncbi:hypothetical protein RYX36_011886 [Vicia faba]
MVINSPFAVMHLSVAAVLISLVSFANAFTRNDFPPNFLFGAGTSAYQDNPGSLQKKNRDHMADMAAEIKPYSGNGTYTYEFPVTPWILQGMLQLMKNDFGNFPIYLHEIGQQTRRNSSLDDWSRVKYMHEYIGGVLDMLRSGLNIRGYFVWAFLDVFELLNGLEGSFGLYYVHFEDPSLRRQPKRSAAWYSNFLNNKSLDSKIAMKTEENSSVLANTS